MLTEDLIPAGDFCASHNIEISFISTLHQSGLIEMTTIRDTGFIYPGQLQDLEKFISFHYELDINMEGIEAITHLLHKVDDLQHELGRLKNRLRFLEKNEFEKEVFDNE
jgi:hypothetical protein